ncbi:MAG: hypothetical protein AUJ28_00910 [Parcubacteria group bacterium CG1_02_37_51]|uniref:Uncharacterized protein n=2 Tax=Candidatus Komeiliibacteriota TaxID=1817908 RepID=A0A2M8DRL6_9BACT|nr:MAG: hypothetical protein AUJ28_00910 [Parcubacteria group bacterium CG1_02_37_51]PIY95109.1 MAG: hypothetical protein COY67_01440 [Candidatus Komeilibacteria bacterium CG_4_10_14_0_8_um_filter_37_78]PJC02023.1 MAG: hypothetical protein CO073_01635 [Candidatus Komeilibacteria bacterium CG_4_9_14_0_8_um_filter_36_9]
MPEFDPNDLVEQAKKKSQTAIADLAEKSGLGRQLKKLAISGCVPIVGIISGAIAFIVWWGVKIFQMKLKGVSLDVGILTSLLVWLAFFIQFLSILTILIVLVAIIKLITLDFT